MMIEQIKNLWQYGVLLLIIGGAVLLRQEFPNEIFGMAITAFYLTLIFYLAEMLMGRTWALLPTVFIAFDPLLLSIGAKELLGILCATAAIGVFGKFLTQPSKIMLGVASVTLGLALTTRTDSLALIPLYTLIITIYYVASVARDWDTTDPTMRRSRFYVRGVRYYRAIFIMIVGGFVIVYIGYYLNTFLPWTDETSETKTFIVNWLNDNDALHPLGNYVDKVKNDVDQYFATGTIENSIKKLWGETLPMLIFIAIGILLMAIKGIGEITYSIRNNTTPILDYIGTHIEEITYIFAACLYTLIDLRTGQTLQIALPLVIIIGTLYCKYRISNEIENPYRLRLQFSIASRPIRAVTVTTIAIAAGIIWHITSVLVHFYR